MKMLRVCFEHKITQGTNSATVVSEPVIHKPDAERAVVLDSVEAVVACHRRRPYSNEREEKDALNTHKDFAAMVERRPGFRAAAAFREHTFAGG